MIDTLPESTEEHPDPREEMIDGPLRVTDWDIVGGSAYEPDETVVPGAPSWWHGEEEASASFFKAMNINPDTLQRR